MRRLRRRPPFALVLVVMVAALGGALALESAGGGGQSDNNVPTVPDSGPAYACVTSRVGATATATKTLRAPVAATIPVSVSERSGAVAVTLSEKVAERAVASRLVEVRRGAVAEARSCSHGPTKDGARGVALTRAYKAARKSARARARVAADRAVAAFAAHERPLLISSAQQQIYLHAESAAAAVRATLAREALSRARLQ